MSIPIDFWEIGGSLHFKQYHKNKLFHISLGITSTNCTFDYILSLKQAVSTAIIFSFFITTKYLQSIIMQNWLNSEM